MEGKMKRGLITGIIMGIVLSGVVASVLAVFHIYHLPYVSNDLKEALPSDMLIHRSIGKGIYVFTGTVSYEGNGKVLITTIKGRKVLMYTGASTRVYTDSKNSDASSLSRGQEVLCIVRESGGRYYGIVIRTITHGSGYRRFYSNA